MRRSTCRLFSTVETDPIDTPANSATLRTVTRGPFRPEERAGMGGKGKEPIGDRTQVRLCRLLEAAEKTFSSRRTPWPSTPEQKDREGREAGPFLPALTGLPVAGSEVAH